MKRLGLLLILVLGICTLLPSNVSALTNQNLEWAVQENDEFQFNIDVNASVQWNEDITFLINTPPPAILDSIEQWSDLSFCTVEITYSNGTSFGLNTLIFLFAISLCYPVGNWSLIEDIFLEEYSSLYDDLTFRDDAQYWGYDFSIEMVTQIAEISVSFQKNDGFLATYEYVGYNITESGQYNVLGEIRAFRDDLAPVIDGPPDLEYYVNDVSERLHWYVFDENPAQYEIKQNGSVIDSGEWTGDTTRFRVLIGTLDVGHYVYEIILTDSNMNTATDIVQVTILESPIMVDDIAPTDQGLFGMSWLSIIITIGAICVIVVFGFLIARSRKHQ